jgi:hypothetical protein
VPIAAVAFLGATFWQYMWPDGLLFPTNASAYEVRELWPEASGIETDRRMASADTARRD